MAEPGHNQGLSRTAVKNGATCQELAATLGVAVALGAGAALVYSARALDAWAAHSTGAAVTP